MCRCGLGCGYGSLLLCEEFCLDILNMWLYIYIYLIATCNEHTHICRVSNSSRGEDAVILSLGDGFLPDLCQVELPPRCLTTHRKNISERSLALRGRWRICNSSERMVSREGGLAYWAYWPQLGERCFRACSERLCSPERNGTGLYEHMGLLEGCSFHATNHKLCTVRMYFVGLRVSNAYLIVAGIL